MEADVSVDDGTAIRIMWAQTTCAASFFVKLVKFSFRSEDRDLLIPPIVTASTKVPTSIKSSAYPTGRNFPVVTTIPVV